MALNQKEPTGEFSGSYYLSEVLARPLSVKFVVISGE